LGGRTRSALLAMGALGRYLPCTLVEDAGLKSANQTWMYNS
jgi:hypothetical protein